MKTFDERKDNVQTHINRIRQRRRTLTAVTSVAMVLVIFALVLFVPFNTDPPSTEQYRGDQYYELIQKLNLATYNPPKYQNLWEVGTSFFDVATKTEDAVVPIAPGASIAGSSNVSDGISNGAYVEVTDNQVQGVTEGDIFKRSTEYIFYLQGLALRVYSIAKEESYLVGCFTVQKNEYQQENNDKYGKFYQFECKEMYLSKDCCTITIIAQSYHQSTGSCTEIISLDVTDPANISETNRVIMSGSYLSSRVVDGKLLVMSNYRIKPNDVDFDEPATFVPQVGTTEEMKLVAPQSIASPETLTNLAYTVISVTDEKTLELMDTAAVLSYSDQIYVSEDTVFVSRSFTHVTEKDVTGCFAEITQTEIMGIRYAGESLEFVGSVTLDGTVKNQYSMDQHKGILRVVTSTTSRGYKEFGDQFTSGMTILSSQRNVNLYCVDLEKWEIAASVIGFAPDGETAESVRFDGDQAYVCTAVVVTLTDPVYFFDLSDLDNITYTDTGTIDGYSSSLIQLGDGFLLGIGYGDSRQLKIEVYEELEGKVVSVCAYELDAAFSEEYKCYYIDRENDMIGLPVRHDDGMDYLLLHFDGYELNCITTSSWYGSIDEVRATVIDGYLYVLSHDFVVKQVW